MQVKIDTREKFHAITIMDPTIAANMTAELDDCLLSVLQNGVKNVVLNLEDIQTLDNAAAEQIASLQRRFHENGASFVICGLSAEAERALGRMGLSNQLGVVPTESEARDMVLMEEIERELANE